MNKKRGGRQLAENWTLGQYGTRWTGEGQGPETQRGAGTIT
jgi:hypothetical protein